MNPLAWLNPGRWLLYGALVAALVLGYRAWADHVGDVREDEVRAQYASQAKTIDGQRSALAPPIIQKAAAAQVQIRTITKTILQEVPTYVKNTDCPMPGGFRLLHDAAAHGQLPDPARVPDAASVPAGDVAATVADNYGACQQTAARLSGLQEWVRAQSDAK